MTAGGRQITPESSFSCSDSDKNVHGLEQAPFLPASQRDWLSRKQGEGWAKMHRGFVVGNLMSLLLYIHFWNLKSPVFQGTFLGGHCHKHYLIASGETGAGASPEMVQGARGPSGDRCLKRQPTCEQNLLSLHEYIRCGFLFLLAE